MLTTTPTPQCPVTCDSDRAVVSPHWPPVASSRAHRRKQLGVSRSAPSNTPPMMRQCLIPPTASKTGLSSVAQTTWRGKAVPHAAHSRSVVQLHSGADRMVGGRRNVDLKETPAESVVELHAEVPLPTAAGEPGGPCPPDRFCPPEGAALRVVEDLVVAGSDGSAGSPGDGCCGIRSEHRARHEPQVALDLHVGSDPVRPGAYQRARAGRQGGKGPRIVIRPIARGSVGLPQERERQPVARGRRRLPFRRGGVPALDRSGRVCWQRERARRGEKQRTPEGSEKQMTALSIHLRQVRLRLLPCRTFVRGTLRCALKPVRRPWSAGAVRLAVRSGSGT